MNNERFQYIKALFEFERLSRNEQDELIEEVERLQATQAALLAAAQAISEKVADHLLDYIGPSGALSVPLSQAEIEALRAAIAKAKGDSGND